MREKITIDFEKKIKELKISELERDTYLKKYSRSSLIELILYTIILIVMLFNFKQVQLLSHMSLSSLFNNTLAGVLIFALLIIVIAFLLTNVLLFGLGYKKIINIKDNTYIKYHSVVEGIQFLFKGLFIIYFLFTIVFSNARVEGPSMENSFHTNDRVVLWHVNYTPAIDDVIVARITEETYPSAVLSAGETESYYIKRIVACPGDIVRIDYNSDGLADMYVNDVFTESLTNYQVYVMFDNAIVMDKTYIVPEDKVIVFGDNRNNSTDSRKLGMINTSDLMGKVVFRLYPFSEFGQITKDIKE